MFRCDGEDKGLYFGQMSEVLDSIEIPKRSLFKAAEVCDLVKVQPYVLRSWEAEFPEPLGKACLELGQTALVFLGRGRA